MLTTALLLHTPPEKEYFFDEGCYILELSNTTHDADVSIAQARVKPGVTTHWHYLLDVVERYVILSGHGVVDVDNLTARGEPWFGGTYSSRLSTTYQQSFR